VDRAEVESPATEGAWVWPTAIVVGLLLVVLVNVGFIVVAVGGADEVVESYTTEAR
jgi:hypothetical protein